MHLSVRDLCVRYGEQRVLQNVSFTVERGEFVSIVGKSGCGKSTLLNALAGFIKSEGEVQIPAEVGIVFQSYAVFPWLTVRENISFGLHQINGQQREALIASHLEMTGLSREAHKYPAQLSGGEIQRVALARALAANPEVLLMDEPFGALDLYTREKMQSWLLGIWERNQKTVLFVTHSIEEAIFLSDRVLIFGGGQVRGEVPVPFARPRYEEMKFTSPFGEIKRRIYGLIESS
jgi:ABC-type nitrate/sulfonate/bicarbonate transport system ATPase subunit